MRSRAPLAQAQLTKKEVGGAIAATSILSNTPGLFLAPIASSAIYQVAHEDIGWVSTAVFALFVALYLPTTYAINRVYTREKAVDA